MKIIIQSTIKNEHYDEIENMFLKDKNFYI